MNTQDEFTENTKEYRDYAQSQCEEGFILNKNPSFKCKKHNSPILYTEDGKSYCAQCDDIDISKWHYYRYP